MDIFYLENLLLVGYGYELKTKHGNLESRGHWIILGAFFLRNGLIRCFSLVQGHFHWAEGTGPSRSRFCTSGMCLLSSGTWILSLSFQRRKKKFTHRTLLFIHQTRSGCHLNRLDLAFAGWIGGLPGMWYLSKSQCEGFNFSLSVSCQLKLQQRQVSSQPYHQVDPGNWSSIY